MMETKQNEAAPSDASTQTLDHIVDGKKAWVRADIKRDDWFFRLTPECLSELRAILPELRKKNEPVEQNPA